MPARRDKGAVQFPARCRGHAELRNDGHARPTSGVGKRTLVDHIGQPPGPAAPGKGSLDERDGSGRPEHATGLDGGRSGSVGLAAFATPRPPGLGMREPSSDSDSDANATDEASTAINAADAAMDQAVADGGEVPYRAEMEQAFGEDFGAVRAKVGASAVLGDLGALGAARGEEIAFASPSPDRGVVAHELAHIVQRRRGGASPDPLQLLDDARSARSSTRAPATSPRSSWPDRLPPPPQSATRRGAPPTHCRSSGDLRPTRSSTRVESPQPPSATSCDSSAAVELRRRNLATTLWATSGPSAAVEQRGRYNGTDGEQPKPRRAGAAGKTAAAAGAGGFSKGGGGGTGRIWLRYVAATPPIVTGVISPPPGLDPTLP